ncbi:hypothetical protein PIB30_000473 [Stylosanthes scabra]|uniref:Uncharacterized protein n=1 Tax=Stylosanthes scabra TaxID=79078 RepID=A0ABU6V5N0_9FABA|nr:hypothetical protein [Stylosanthes scabra]
MKKTHENMNPNILKRDNVAMDEKALTKSNLIGISKVNVTDMRGSPKIFSSYKDLLMKNDFGMALSSDKVIKLVAEYYKTDNALLAVNVARALLNLKLIEEVSLEEVRILNEVTVRLIVSLMESEQRFSEEEAGGCGRCCYCEKLKEGSCNFEDGDPLARSSAFSRIEA